MKTVICDIDGTLLHYLGYKHLMEYPENSIALPNVLKKLDEWGSKNYNIILITGRRESLREFTEDQLSNAGIAYDHLIMGVGPGERHLINDQKNDGSITAFAHCPVRNEGLGGLDI